MSKAEASAPENIRAFAMKIAFDRLAARDRSVLELRQALEKKQVPTEVINSVLEKLAHQGFIDDERFALAWVSSRHRTKGLACGVLSRELQLKGISPEHIESALASIDEEDERLRAHQLVQRRLPSLARYEVAVQKRRLSAFLIRKGYPPHLSFEVVNEEVAAYQAERE